MTIHSLTRCYRCVLIMWLVCWGAWHDATSLGAEATDAASARSEESVQAPVGKRTKGAAMGRRRRIIVNDDSQPQFEHKDPASYLADRFNPVIGTQVDTYIIYVGDGWHPHRDRKPAAGLGDVNKLIVDAAHKAGIEIFASLRMNDIHCSHDGTARPLKREKPHLLIGEAFAFTQFNGHLKGESPGPAGGYPEGSLLASFWAGYDYAEPEVRALRLKRIEHIARQYDYDGFELDFFRHPLFFKPGEEQANLETMTGFVRQVRETLNEAGRERGRPYLLAVRVPDSPKFALRTGLDVENWLEQGLPDMLMIGGGYMPYSARVKEFIDLAHRHNVPAYPSVDVDTFPPTSGPFDAHLDPLKMRSIASNFWALGADGVYVFNWYGPAPSYYGFKVLPEEKQKLMHQLGDPATLAGLDKQYLPDYGCDINYCGYTRAPSTLPVRIIDGSPIELVVGDDVERAEREGRIKSLRLRLQISNLGADENIAIQINQVQLAADAIRRVDENSLEAAVGAPPLRRGINQIVFLPGRNSIGRPSSTVRSLELVAAYH